MKKMTAWLMAALLVFALAGCGTSNTPTATETPVLESPAATEVPATKEPEATATPTPAPTEEPAAEESSVEEMKELVLGLKDHPVQELYDAIGEPTGEAEYASSCLVTGGQDGTLPYDGFTVYTIVQPDGTETVYDVE